MKIVEIFLRLTKDLSKMRFLFLTISMMLAGFGPSVFAGTIFQKTQDTLKLRITFKTNH